MININDGNFAKEVLQSNKPVLVDFWAEWCGPCKALSPVIDNLASDKYKVFKANVEENQSAMDRYQIRSVPTVMIFKDGEEVGRYIGVKTKEEYLSILGGVMND